jgi:carbonic anhydrase
MKRALALTVAVGCCLAGERAAAEDTGPHWDYGAEHGPAHWAGMKADYQTCGVGKHQSPIDITTTKKAQLPSPKFDYSRTPLRIVNNGHTIQVNVPPGSAVAVGDHQYALQQFHFHAPSEEAVRGKHHALVAHFVHKDVDGKLAVVAVLFDVGKANPALEPVFERLPAKEGEEEVFDQVSIDPASVLPAQHGYYEFEGSLTTPPCSEGVRWLVLKQPVTLSQAQLDAFRKLFPRNARPVQPLNGRVVRESAG